MPPSFINPHARGPVARRFWRLVKKTSGCWEWTGCVSNRGYGRFGINDYPFYAHRISWWLNTGTFPSKWVLHHCDNRLCVRPSHLFLGTHRENMQDAKAKGRLKRSVDIEMKLTTEDVLKIKNLHPAVGQQELAKRFHVDRSHISRILSGQTRILATAAS